MRGARCIVSIAAFSTLPLACGGGGTSEWPKGNVVLKDTNNYSSLTKLTIPVIPTASGADLMVCWDGVKKDLLCHALVPDTDDIDNVGFLQIPNMSQQDVEAKLAVGKLDENLVKIYREYRVPQPATSSCAMLSQFALGTALNPATDYVEPAAGKTLTYMLLFATGTTPGVGSRAMAFLEPMAAMPSVTTVAAPDACDHQVLQFNATLGAPMMISATDNKKWHLDWSQITKDSFGNAVDFSALDNVLLGFYQGMTAADLQAHFTDIEINATTMYAVPVAPGARDVDLVTATIRNGSDPFPGFTQTDGVWAVAVRCSKCQIPAPVVMTILQPQ
jgi:hypothetical protein